MLCPTCGEENPHVARFCMGCGLALAGLCAACGQQNPPVARFCINCGGAVAASDRASSSSPQRRDAQPPIALPTPGEYASTSRIPSGGERKQITALFCDLVNSVAITERLGSE